MARKNTNVGLKYIVQFDAFHFFEPGEIVVALEEDDVAMFVREKDYLENGKSLSLNDYPMKLVHPLDYNIGEIVLVEGYECDISRMITISTCHIDEYTATRMNINKSVYSATVYRKDEYGWFVYINEGFEEEDNPECLKACMRFAKKNECEWLCLDSDGPVMKDLPVYEW